MNKPKISTRTIEKNNKIRKIIGTLRNFPEGTTPKIIAYHSNININTVKSLLPQITTIKKKGGMRGIYVLVDEEDHGSIFDWNFHNAILSYNIPDYTGERIIKTNSFGFINYKFEIGKESKKATLNISTDHPLNISSLFCCYLLFSELIKRYAAVYPSPDKIWISTIEFNQDYKNLRLDGPKCITLDSLLAQFKVYEKKQGVRIEQKLKVPINSEVILSILSNSTNSIDNNQMLSHLSKNIEVMLHFLERIGDTLMALLDKMDSERIKV